MRRALPGLAASSSGRDGTSRLLKAASPDNRSRHSRAPLVRRERGHSRVIHHLHILDIDVDTDLETDRHRKCHHSATKPLLPLEMRFCCPMLKKPI